jgi:YD repeat-containing protein
MVGALARGHARSIASWAVVLLGAVACHRVAPTEGPTGAPARARAPEHAKGSAPEIEAAQANAAVTSLPAAEPWSPPAGLTEPGAEVVIDWERPPPKGVRAAARRPTPSQPLWELLVDRPWQAPVPLDDVSRPCRREHYLAHDTRPLRTVELKYDAAGRVVRERIDDDTDGSIELEHEWTWGSDGLLEREHHRTGAQPSCGGRIPESVVETRHRYDAHGVWLGGQTFYDGRPEEKPSWRTTTYDPEGHLTSYLVYPTYEPQRLTTMRWVGDDEMVEWLDHVGPSPTRVERWQAGSDGWRWHALWSGADPWVVDRSRYSNGGLPLVTERDANGDGRVDARTVWRRDDQDRVLSEERDTDGDGDVDEHIEHEWDAAGKLVSRVHVGSAGTRRERSEYDAGGRLVRWTSKLDESWVEDVREYAFDATGRELERRTVYHHAVGSVGDVRNYVTREHWRGERDGEGRLVRAFVEAGEIGPDERVEYSYDCSKPYRRHPRRNPLDHPERAPECQGHE